MSGTLVQLSVSDGGMPKMAVAEAMVGADGVAGDPEGNLKYHGGPDRAVCIYSVELYDWLRENGIDLKAGAIGENFTLRGIDIQKLGPGDRLRVGNCLIEITDVRTPCGNLKMWDPQLLKLIQGRSGWVARVIESAVVRPGDSVDVVPR